MEMALTETERRRGIQQAYNEKHGIIPKTIRKDVADVLEISSDSDDNVEHMDVSQMSRTEREKLIKKLTKEMKTAAKLLEFEHAAYLRDKISLLSLW